MTKQRYQCQECDRTVEIDPETDEEPMCCDKAMEQLPLDICTEPQSAEWSRPMDDDEPCDDFRG